MQYNTNFSKGYHTMKDRKQVYLRVALALYCAVMIYLLFFNGRQNYFNLPFSDYVRRNTNFIPFQYIVGYFRNIMSGENFHYAIVNLVGNVAVFIPLGALIPLVFKKLASFWKYILSAIIIPVVIESIQLVFMVGCFDVDDIILNVLGLLIGYGIYALIKKHNCTEIV